MIVPPGTVSKVEPPAMIVDGVAFAAAGGAE
jgi:hypothetical protein